MLERHIQLAHGFGRDPAADGPRGPTNDALVLAEGEPDLDLVIGNTGMDVAQFR